MRSPFDNLIQTKSETAQNEKEVYLFSLEQLRTKILAEAENGGGVLAGELQLAEEIGCSRGTLRKALKTLEDEGLLLRQQGKRTRISPVNVNFMTWQLADEVYGDCFAQAATICLEEHPLLKLKLDGPGYDTYFAEMVKRLVSVEGLDLLEIVDIWLPALIELNALEPLDLYVPQETVERMAERWGGMTRLMRDGHLWAFPMGMGPSLLYVRNSHRAPEYLSEVGQSELTFGIPTDSREQTGFNLVPWLWAKGGGLVTNGSLDLDMEKTAKALEWMQGLIESGHLVTCPGGVGELRKKFLRGEINAYFDGPWGMHHYEGSGLGSHEYHYQLPPLNDDGSCTPYLINHLVAVPRRSRYPRISASIAFRMMDDERGYLEKVGLYSPFSLAHQKAPREASMSALVWAAQRVGMSLPTVSQDPVVFYKMIAALVRNCLVHKGDPFVETHALSEALHMIYD